uniref:Uncharacterized protein n=1 Tax=Caenorhabditis japonica TaxID=281687 RepID=A0A8R1IB34_CAEJA
MFDYRDLEAQEHESVTNERRYRSPSGRFDTDLCRTIATSSLLIGDLYIIHIPEYVRCPKMGLGTIGVCTLVDLNTVKTVI